MPVGKLKNLVYGAALPLVGKRCQWTAVSGGAAETNEALAKVLRKRRAVGACVQRFEKGALTECCTAGFARLSPEKMTVTPDTVFRTASIAKMVTALLVFRLQTKGLLDVEEPMAAFLGYPVQNPRYPDRPLTLGMALSHTSSLVDSPAYFASFSNPGDLRGLLSAPASYASYAPGAAFRYSNLAAGAIGCMLEKRFGESFEALAQRELFAPLGVEATFDLSRLRDKPLADNARVFPNRLCFDAGKRAASASALDAPDADSHYLLASGGLFLTAEALARLALVVWNGKDGFIDPRGVSAMQTPAADWPRKEIRMRYGMGLLKLEDSAAFSRPLWGHQGFAYGAVNGVFFDAEGNGFAALNSGVSEQRKGHLALVNRDLIRVLLEGGGGKGAQGNE